jgi:polysaccharide pyruvyl transferase WcaK-like protein
LKTIKNKIVAIRILLSSFFKRLKLMGLNTKNIAYIGGHGHGNYGDDVMFNILSKHLANEGYTLITIHSYGIEKALRYFRLSGPAFFKKIILGGGTLINDMWFYKVESLINLDVPLLSLGTGVGSCGIEQNKNIDFLKWKHILDKFDEVNVRGAISKERLFSIGVKSNIVGDLALLNAKTEVSKVDRKKIVLNLMNITEYNFFWESLIPKIKSLSDDGWEITPLILNTNDCAYTKEYFKKLNIKGDFSLVKDEIQFQNIIDSTAFSICVRLHGAVLSTIENIPTILFGYRDKCLDFMGSINQEGFYLNVDQISKDQFNIDDQLSELMDFESNNKVRTTINTKILNHKNNITLHLKKSLDEYTTY